MLNHRKTRVCQLVVPATVVFGIPLMPFLANVLRYVRYMLLAVRLSSDVFRLSVTLVRPIQPAEVFGNFFFTIR